MNQIIWNLICGSHFLEFEHLALMDNADIIVWVYWKWRARSVISTLLLLLMFVCLELEAFLLLLMNLLAHENKTGVTGKVAFATLLLHMEESEGWFDSLFFANTMEYLWIRAKWFCWGRSGEWKHDQFKQIEILLNKLCPYEPFLG